MVQQGSIQGVRNNWRWMSKLLKCTDIHLHNAADYHQVTYITFVMHLRSFSSAGTTKIFNL